MNTMSIKKLGILAVGLALGTLAITVFSVEDESPLPNWIDKSREKPDGKPPVVYTREVPPSDFRVPAEYEPTRAVVLGWRGYTGVLKEIAKAINEETDVEIWGVSGPNYIAGVEDDAYSKVGCNLNTVWMRDYGPVGISLKEGTTGVVDSIYRHYQYRRKDDALPTCLAAKKNLNAYGMDLILDGGNLMLDSSGNLFMTKRTYLWNDDKTIEEVNQKLMDHFNVRQIHALDYAGYPSSPADGTGHIDMFVKLLNDNTVLISTGDKEPFKTNSEKAIEYFTELTAPNGEPYRIITVPGWSRYGTWYTYTNSLIVNNLVLVPAYQDAPDKNQVARRAYEKGIPGVIVRLIYSDGTIGAGGSIHCITQTIPAIVE